MARNIAKTKMNQTKRSNRSSPSQNWKQKLDALRRREYDVPAIGMGTDLAFGFPDRIITKVRYHDIVTLSSTAGAVGKWLFRANSTFDPDFTGTGHQPLYRDNLAAIYDHYSVLECVVKGKLCNTSATAPFTIGVVIDDDSSTGTTLTTLCEQNHSKHTFLPPLAGSLSSHTFNVKWDPVTFLGIDPFVTEGYKTPVGSNPGEESYITFFAASVDGSTSSIVLDITMEYTVLWTELTSPTQS